MKALLRDASSPEIPESEVQSKLLTKSMLASTGLTAAGASLLATEYLKDIRAELGDGSERPLRENSGPYVNHIGYMTLACTVDPR